MHELTNLLVPLGLVIACTACLGSAQEAAAGNGTSGRTFQRISHYPVYRNLAQGQDTNDKTVSEIVAAADNGQLLLYTDGAQNRIGLVDISDPWKPRGTGFLQLTGEPTSVAVTGRYALAAVNTSEDFQHPSGQLDVIDLVDSANPELVRSIDMGGQPDSVAVSPDGKYAVVAVENERDERACANGQGKLIGSAYGKKDLCKTAGGVLGGIPQLPSGFLNIIDLVATPDRWQVRRVALSGLAEIAPADPEPEYVDINSDNVAVVSLQENNHIALIDLSTGEIVSNFSAGTADLDEIDAERNMLLDPVHHLAGIPREPDAVAWVGNKLIATANEGDYEGGSRGFTLFDRRGSIVQDANNSIEHLALRSGHYPERRAGKKGTEPEGVTTGRYGNRHFLFVGSERGNFVSVYDIKDDFTVELLQLLPTGMGPEGLLAIPERDLFLAASEVDNASAGIRSMITLYQLQDGKPNYPKIQSQSESLVGWGALSGLTAAPDNPGLLYAVHNASFAQARIFPVDLNRKPALIGHPITLTLNGNPVNYDLEGIAARPQGGFWVVSEGTGGRLNILARVNHDGTVEQEISLPEHMRANRLEHGFEGVAVQGSGPAEVVTIVVQRGWADDPDGFTKIAQYFPAEHRWDFFYYPLDRAPEKAWVGLSEITPLNDGSFAILERDNLQGDRALVKRLYRIEMDSSSDQGLAYPVLRKTLARDLISDLASGTGWIQGKPNGLAVTADGQVYLVTNNDGVHNTTGETLFLHLGNGIDLFQ